MDAVNLLEPLFDAIEPMQETVAVRICLLLIELYLSLNSFAQAASKPALCLDLERRSDCLLACELLLLWILHSGRCCLK